jgi:dolichol kinase
LAPAGSAWRLSDRERRLALIFAASTVSAGVIVAFLPFAVGASGSVAALGLFVQAVAATISRWGPAGAATATVMPAC